MNRWIGVWEDKGTFPKTIPAIELKAAAYLSACGIQLLDLDLPSVDSIDCKELLAHHQLTNHGIHILEGLVLEHVHLGEYKLVALPLLIVKGEESPVRAVLKGISQKE